MSHNPPTFQEIRVRAYYIWIMKCASSWCSPDQNTAEINWMEAEREMKGEY